ncbi:MAG TPA: metalloregulator ArsR/SmtB family transcription factor [Chloroflexaceae bacterium]|nr:metalloregulator ArsR/SmtB family transcription factor [Chloroflexaceae bacterium]
MRAAPTAAPEPQDIFAALADPTRRSLVGHLAGHSPKTATQLAAVYPITRQGILKHLAVLEQAGLVRVEQAGREKRYSLTPAPLADVAAWVAEIGALWDARLLRLKALVEGASPGE